jgi:hypothetical protein
MSTVPPAVHPGPLLKRELRARIGVPSGHITDLPPRAAGGRGVKMLFSRRILR